ncbi:MAG TPA: transglycosylase domain-containing protein [Chthoniobacterales bacterium]
MLYLFLFVLAVATGLVGLGIVPHPGPYLRARWASASFAPAWSRRIGQAALAAAPSIRRIRLTGLGWKSGAVYVLIGALAIAALLVAIGFHHVYFDRSDLPDVRAFAAFEFPTIGHVYDVHGAPLTELAREHRQITEYKGIPPIVRDAILAAEDKNFFSHSGVDYSGIPRVLWKVRLRTLLARLVGLSRSDGVDDPIIFPQGGSTITQQLVRGHFLNALTAEENSSQLRHGGLLPRILSFAIGARNVNMAFRKLEEIRLSLWLESEMRERFGSKRRAKEEIFARYASFIYMGRGQYGFARAAEYYFGRPLGAFTVDDADKAALLAGIAKSPLVYAPSAPRTDKVLKRRNQTLTLMAANGFISGPAASEAVRRPIRTVARNNDKLQTAAVVESVLQEIKDRHLDVGLEDLLQGRIQVHSTVDAGVQRIMNDALERGLEFYEQRHPSAKGVVQGSVVVLKNADASILAETGGRRFYRNRAAAYSDFNRVTKSLRQPGSAMKPMVYLAAFQQGTFNLQSMVPDEPISVPDGAGLKWIANYDGEFKGMIPLREALAESRNAVAVWITKQVGIASVLKTARSLGVRTALHPYATTALGASEVNLLELANAYRTIASGVLAQPHLIRQVADDSGAVLFDSEDDELPVDLGEAALPLIQEGLRGVVRIPGGTAHALDSRDFPIAVIGKTGTTNEFRDALFVGSTYGPEGITIGVRIGFDDNRSLGPKETGARVALPVFREIMLRVYGDKLVGPVPEFPARLEQGINNYLTAESPLSAPMAEAPRP